MIEYITAHPMYIPFLIGNALIIYEVIKIVRKDGDDNNDDGDGGILLDDDPTLDLPPGVTLPVSPKEPVLAD